MGKRSLVLESGGIKGISLIGAVDYLYEQGILTQQDTKEFIGSSAGSVVCLLLAVGYTPKEISKIIIETDFKYYLNDPWYYTIWNLKSYNGLHTCYRFTNLLAKLLKKKGFNKNTTLLELYQQTGNILVTTGTSLNTRDVYYFNYFTTPDIKVIQAVKISISIPFLFSAEKITLDNKQYTFTDGGVLKGYPLYYFDICRHFNTYYKTDSDILDAIEKNEEKESTKLSQQLHQLNDTIGVLILEENKEQNNKYYNGFDQINGILDFTKAFVNTIMTTIEKNNIENPLVFNQQNDFWTRTIVVRADPNVDATDFNLSKEIKQSLIQKSYIDAVKSPNIS